jgi:hypothetical protein
VNGDRPIQSPGWKLPVFIQEDGSWEKWSGPIRGEERGRSSGSQEGVCSWWGEVSKSLSTIGVINLKLLLLPFEEVY